MKSSLTKMSGNAPYSCLLPDIPQWVETNGLLISRRGKVFGEKGDTGNFIVVEIGGYLASVVGQPAPHLLCSALGQALPYVEVLATEENRDFVASILPKWQQEPALIYEFADAAALAPAPTDLPVVSFIGSRELSGLQANDPVLYQELLHGLRFSDLAAYLVDGEPVSFCYSGFETHRLWDISIQTLPGHRRKGYARAVVSYMFGHMHKKGKAPVWGALESNEASQLMAESLGFRHIDHLHVFSQST